MTKSSIDTEIREKRIKHLWNLFYSILEGFSDSEIEEVEQSVATRKEATRPVQPCSTPDG